MLRGILGPMEKHHKVRISDAAIVAAVNLSHRYIPARQLPDKAVSLLDTAAARVAISQSATPAMIEDARVAIAAREAEKAALVSDGDLGADDKERIAEIDTRNRGAEGEARRPRGGMGHRAGAGRRDPQPARDPAPKPKRQDRRRPTPVRQGRAQQLRGKFDALEGARSRKADDLRACRRAGGRLRRVRLDRHSGRPHGERRNRNRPAAAGNPQPARRRPVARAGDDRQADRDQPRQARQSQQADRRLHARAARPASARPRRRWRSPRRSMAASRT